MKQHGERKHSVYSASGAIRWFNCPGSVSLSEGVPDKASVYSLEGTKAHEVLETILNHAIKTRSHRVPRVIPGVDYTKETPKEMILHGINAANFILDLHEKTPGSELLVETRIHIPEIHPDMFGTFDGAIVEHFGTLHVIDYKYGAGHSVSPVENLQMIFYGIGLAFKYDWNFKKVRLWIIQPRIRGYDGPIFWEMSIFELKQYVAEFESAVRRVAKTPSVFVEGAWCHWCKAKTRCPIKQQGKIEQAKAVFSASPIQKGR